MFDARRMPKSGRSISESLVPSPPLRFNLRARVSIAFAAPCVPSAPAKEEAPKEALSALWLPPFSVDETSDEPGAAFDSFKCIARRDA